MANKQLKFMAIIIPTKYTDDFFEKHPQHLKNWNKIEKDYQMYRVSKGKKPWNNYIIVNQDEPYAEKVWEIILTGETAKGDTNGRDRY